MYVINNYMYSLIMNIMFQKIHIPRNLTITAILYEGHILKRACNSHALDCTKSFSKAMYTCT